MPDSRWRSVSWTVCGLLLAASDPAVARTWLVPAEVPSIAAGLDSAAAGDTVLVACGTYLESALSMKASVTLRGATGIPACVTIDAQQQGRVIDCQGLPPGTRIEGLTLTGGLAADGGVFGNAGGGLRCDSSSVEVSDCDFTGNSAKFGAGLASRDGSPVLTRCTFAGNVASQADWAAGGGVYALRSAPVLAECTFTANSATSVQLPADGGGIFCDESTLLATDCTLDGNTAEAGAGGFYSFSHDRSALVRCTFTNNQANAGGATYVENSSPVFTDCVFTTNQAWNGGACFLGALSRPDFAGCRFDSNAALPNSGGAIDCWQSFPEFDSCSFVGNSAEVQGGAVSLNGSSTIALTDCLFDGNSAGSSGGAIRLGDTATATVAGCDLVGNSAAGQGGGVFCDGQSAATIDRTVIAFGPAGPAVECAGAGSASLTCSDLFGNAGGDWVGCVASQAGGSGNLSQDPQFCSVSTGDLTVTLPSSPCLPGNNSCGQRIGLLGGGCGCPPAATILVPADHATIGGALAAASPGDVIGICDGVYPETLQLVPGVHVAGVRTDLVRVEWGPAGSSEALLFARGLADSTVVEGLTLDGRSVVTQVVLAESASTGLHLRGNRITGGALRGILVGPDSRLRLGGALADANDLFDNGTGMTIHLRNENVTADSLDATLNWWGTTRYDSILTMVEGPVRTCPITNAGHTDSLCAPLTAIAAPPGDAGPVSGLALAVAPNPFATSSRIVLSLPERSPVVRLVIHDVRGRRVRTLVDGPLPPGRHLVRWRGRDDRGLPAAPGVYFLRLEAAGEVRTRKVVRLR